MKLDLRFTIDDLRLLRCMAARLMYAALLVLVASGCTSTRSQVTLDSATAEERYTLISDNVSTLVVGGRISGVRWSEDGSHFTYTSRQQRYRFDLVSHELTAIDQEDEPEVDRGAQRSPRRSPGRGRQRDAEQSPDGKWIAGCKDWNLVVRSATSDDEESPPQEIAITTDGHRKFRYGKASWVYGEELDQTEAIWWSPDSRKLVFYEFDERNVPDHFLAGGLTELHTTILTEGYPKPGEPNPIVNLLIYDVENKAIARVDVGDDPECYIYAVRFTPNGDELLFNRTNRGQNVLDLMAADLETGTSRVVATEQQDTWQHNRPEIRFLADGYRFMWETERSGYRQFELRDLSGALLNTLTRGDYPVASIAHVDEDAGVLYYTAYSGGNPLCAQLYGVNLEGGNERRLTREPLNHSVQFSADGKWFITTYESANAPPTTTLYDNDGNQIAVLANSDLGKFHELYCTEPELFSFKADDGVTNLYGVLFKPAHFDPNRKYPLVVEVYGGPLSQSVRARFTPAMAACEYGFLIAKMDNRGTRNRGKAFEDAAYMKLGDVDLADQVAGVKYLSQRSYVDASRVGIYGHSYGGYMAALAILKYPDVFHAAVAGAPVSDWRNYDTIYTERFMRTPQENPEGYDAGSCMKYVNQLRGKLLILQGMIDDNVHASNAFQLIDALQKADKPFEVMFYPNAGHGLGPHAAKLRWEFLRRHLLN